MKKIPEPKLKSAVELTPAQMNSIHFGGNHTVLTPEQLEGVVNAKKQQADEPQKPGK